MKLRQKEEAGLSWEIIGKYLPLYLSGFTEMHPDNIIGRIPIFFPTPVWGFHYHFRGFFLVA